MGHLQHDQFQQLAQFPVMHAKWSERREQLRVWHRSTDRDVRSLAHWVEEHTAQSVSGRLGKAQIEQLKLIPGMIDCIVAAGADAWREKFKQLQQRIEATSGDLPRCKSADTGERELALWIRKQRLAFMNEHLHKDQIELLNIFLGSLGSRKA